MDRMNEWVDGLPRWMNANESDLDGCKELSKIMMISEIFHSARLTEPAADLKHALNIQCLSYVMWITGMNVFNEYIFIHVNI